MSTMSFYDHRATKQERVSNFNSVSGIVHCGYHTSVFTTTHIIYFRSATTKRRIRLQRLQPRNRGGDSRVFKASRLQTVANVANMTCLPPTQEQICTAWKDFLPPREILGPRKNNNYNYVLRSRLMRNFGRPSPETFRKGRNQGPRWRSLVRCQILTARLR